MALIEAEPAITIDQEQPMASWKATALEKTIHTAIIFVEQADRIIQVDPTRKW